MGRAQVSAFRRQPPPGWRSRASSRYSLRASGASSLARIEPMNRAHLAEHRRKVAGELGVVGAAVAPQRASRWHRVEAENLFHATVAVGGDDQHGPG